MRFSLRRQQSTSSNLSSQDTLGQAQPALSTQSQVMVRAEVGIVIGTKRRAALHRTWRAFFKVMRTSYKFSLLSRPLYSAWLRTPQSKANQAINLHQISSKKFACTTRSTTLPTTAMKLISNRCSRAHQGAKLAKWVRWRIIKRRLVCQLRICFRWKLWQLVEAVSSAVGHYPHPPSPSKPRMTPRCRWAQSRAIFLPLSHQAAIKTRRHQT